MRSIHDRKRVSDFPAVCLNHWRNQPQQLTLYIEGVAYVDDDKRKVMWSEVDRSTKRLSCNELSTEEIKRGVRLRGIPLMLRHCDNIGTVFDDAYDIVPGLDVSGVFIYGSVPVSGPHLDSRMYLATKLLMSKGPISALCDLSLTVKADFFEGKSGENDSLRKTFQEVGVLPEQGGNRPDCTVTKALLILCDGTIIPSF